MSAKHTPGPWEMAFLGYDSHPYYVRALPNYMGGPAIHGSAGAIAKLPASKFHDQEANARLIAAAPEMLEALRWYASVDGDTRAAAIVAKATGEQP